MDILNQPEWGEQSETFHLWQQTTDNTSGEIKADLKPFMRKRMKEWSPNHPTSLLNAKCQEQEQPLHMKGETHFCSVNIPHQVSQDVAKLAPMLMSRVAGSPPSPPGNMFYNNFIQQFCISYKGFSAILNRLLHSKKETNSLSTKRVL